MGLCFQTERQREQPPLGWPRFTLIECAPHTIELPQRLPTIPTRSLSPASGKTRQ